VPPFRSVERVRKHVPRHTSWRCRTKYANGRSHIAAGSPIVGRLATARAVLGSPAGNASLISRHIARAGGSAAQYAMDHTFAIPVYKAAPNLAALIGSLRAQSWARSEILLASSTPSADLDAFAKRQGLPLHINPQRVVIATDWNFALAVARTTFVTLAHQDDLFAPEYVARLLTAMQRHPKVLVAFCDY
jgi:hypothetical protein